MWLHKLPGRLRSSVPAEQFDSVVRLSAVHVEFTPALSAVGGHFDGLGSHSSPSYWFIVFNVRP